MKASPEEMKARRERLFDRLINQPWEKCDGRFKQGESYCIMGAVTKVYQDETGEVMFNGDNHTYINDNDEMENASFAPQVVEYFGLKSNDPQLVWDEEEVSLYDVNDDSDLSIKEIAELMKKHSSKLFKRVRATAKKKAQEVRVTLNEFLGGKLPFNDAHLEAEKRRELQLTGGKKS